MRILTLLGTAGLALTLLGAPALAVKQSSLSGFQDVRFGETRATLVHKLRKKFAYQGANHQDGAPWFIGEFAGYRHCRVFTWVKENRVHRFQVSISAQDDKDTLDIFGDLVTKLEKVYGARSTIRVRYYGGDNIQSYDLKDKDNQTEELLTSLVDDIRAGKAYFFVTWDFPDGNQISLETDRLGDEAGTDQRVLVSYTSATTEEKLDEETLKDL